MQSILTRRIKKGGHKTGYLNTALLSISYIATLILATKTLLNEKNVTLSFILGIIVMELFVVLRMISLHQLGEYFSYEVRILRDHKLVTTGIYGIVRHPLHLAFWGEVCGMAIISKNPFSLIPLLILTIVISWRDKIEDEALEKKFGREFQEYKKQVPGLNIIKGISHIGK